jgi:hypothetical protein
VKPIEVVKKRVAKRGSDSSVVRLVTLSSFWAARMLTNASGRLVPAAMTVRPYRKVGVS